MFKIAPAVYRSASDKWGYHRYDELLESVNSLRGDLFKKEALSAPELFEKFCGMNIHQPFPGAQNEIPTVILMTTSYTFLTTGGPLRKELTLGPPEPCERYELFVPSGWGTRVLEAVRRGGLRAEREPCRFGKRMRSRVYCDGDTNFVM